MFRKFTVPKNKTKVFCRSSLESAHVVHENPHPYIYIYTYIHIHIHIHIHIRIHHIGRIFAELFQWFSWFSNNLCEDWYLVMYPPTKCAISLDYAGYVYIYIYMEVSPMTWTTAWDLNHLRCLGCTIVDTSHEMTGFNHRFLTWRDMAWRSMTWPPTWLWFGIASLLLGTQGPCPVPTGHPKRKARRQWWNSRLGENQTGLDSLIGAERREWGLLGWWN